MQCPNCEKAGCRYNQRNPNLERFPGKGKEMFKRTDFSAKCKYCGWEGKC